MRVIKEFQCLSVTQTENCLTTEGLIKSIEVYCDHCHALIVADFVIPPGKGMAFQFKDRNPELCYDCLKSAVLQVYPQIAVPPPSATDYFKHETSWSDFTPPEEPPCA